MQRWARFSDTEKLELMILARSRFSVKGIVDVMISQGVYPKPQGRNARLDRKWLEERVTGFLYRAGQGLKVERDVKTPYARAEVGKLTSGLHKKKRKAG